MICKFSLHPFLVWASPRWNCGKHEGEFRVMVSSVCNAINGPQTIRQSQHLEVWHGNLQNMRFFQVGLPGIGRQKHQLMDPKVSASPRRQKLDDGGGVSWARWNLRFLGHSLGLGGDTLGVFGGGVETWTPGNWENWVKRAWVFEAAWWFRVIFWRGFSMVFSMTATAGGWVRLVGWEEGRDWVRLREARP